MAEERAALVKEREAVAAERRALAEERSAMGAELQAFAVRLRRAGEGGWLAWLTANQAGRSVRRAPRSW